MLRIGLAQMDIKLGDREANFAAVEEWMKKYWTPSETETAVVLPEMFDVGYVIDEAEKYADRGAERAVEFLSGLARRYDVWFAGGSALAWADGAAVNRALVVNPRGEYVAHYDKVHLVPMMDEDKYLRGGGVAAPAHRALAHAAARAGRREHDVHSRLQPRRRHAVGQLPRLFRRHRPVGRAALRGRRSPVRRVR